MSVVFVPKLEAVSQVVYVSHGFHDVQVDVVQWPHGHCPAHDGIATLVIGLRGRLSAMLLKEVTSAVNVPSAAPTEG